MDAESTINFNSKTSPSIILTSYTTVFNTSQFLFKFQNTQILNSSVDTHVCNNKEDFNFLCPAVEDDYLIAGGNFKKIQAYGIVTITVNTPTRKLKIKLSYVALVPTIFINIIALLRATNNNVYFDLGRNLLHRLATSEIVCYIKQLGGHQILMYRQSTLDSIT